MIAHRIQTKQHLEPSVKFYRTVAISFLLITVLLLGMVIFITTKKATIVVVAKDDIKSVNLSVNIARDGKPGESVSGVVTSTIFAWSEKYSPTGNKSTDTIAAGMLILYNKTNAAQTLVKTTRLITASGILFRLSDRVTVPAMGQIEAKVYADQAGAGSEIGPSQFTIPGLALETNRGCRFAG